MKGRRKKRGAVEYKVKWVGFNNRHNRWVPESDLQCDNLIEEYESANAVWPALDRALYVGVEDSEAFNQRPGANPPNVMRKLKRSAGSYLVGMTGQHESQFAD